MRISVDSAFAQRGAIEECLTNHERDDILMFCFLKNCSAFTKLYVKYNLTYYS